MEYPDCAADGCNVKTTSGSPLCAKHEKQWMDERDQVVALAEHLTERAAAFAAWCAAHGKPDPYD